MKTNIKKLIELKNPNERGTLRGLGGDQLIYKFENGFGASVVCHCGSYGGEGGLLELAVLDRDGSLCYNTSVTSDVKGYLDANATLKLLAQIEELPAREQ